MADTTTETSFRANAFSARGTARDSIALPGELFDGTVNMPVMHQAVKAFLANQRQGNASTKTRGFVVGGNQKPWKQKGTGRARQGSTRAPHWVGGGTVFGPFTSRNLTPRASDGQPAGLSLEEFKEVMHQGTDFKNRHPQISPLLQVMPWPVYGKMSDRELEAIYEYLKAIPCIGSAARCTS